MYPINYSYKFFKISYFKIKNYFCYKPIRLEPMKNLKSFFSFLFMALLSTQAMAQSHISFEVSFVEPQAHYAEVSMLLKGNNQPQIDVKMPVWAPGSYLVREFAKNVEGFKAIDEKGQALASQKVNKSTWRIQNPKKSDIRISYRVYAFEISVRTSFVDASHAFLSPTGIFMYPAGQLAKSSTVTIKPFASWSKVSTGLSPVKAGAFTYTAPNFDILFDSPIEVGNQDVFEFTAAGVRHEVAMYGGGNYNAEKLKVDMAKIVEQATAVFGENPNKYYVFIVHNYASGGGGLEHLNSTVLGHPRGQYASENGYKSFLSLVAHEYFHLWNVKRLRPVALGPFNYDAENYTSNLWIAEGFTAYYDNLFVRRAGFYSPDQYLGMLASGLSTVANQPGSLEQSAHEASFDAWIKQYRPNENSRNSSISYYDKGSIIAMLMDLEILQATSGQKKLDDVMNTMYYQYYYKLARGYTDAEFKDMAGKIAGKSMETFYNDYVYGTKKPDYNAFLKAVGYQLVDDNASKNEPYLGISASARTGKFLITSVARNSPAWRDGLNVNDELLSINDEKVSGTMAELDKAIAAKALGDKLKIGIIRDGLPMTIDLSLDRNPAVRYRFVSVDKPSKEQLLLRAKWLAL